MSVTNSLRGQVSVLFIEIFQLLRRVSLEWCLARQALKHNCSKRPEIYKRNGELVTIAVKRYRMKSHQLLHHTVATWWLQVPCTAMNHQRERLISLVETFLQLTIGDPHRVAAMLPSWRNLANPKSAIFRVIFAGEGKFFPQLCDSNMFCGFRSLCTMPLAKRAFIAPARR